MEMEFHLSYGDQLLIKLIPILTFGIQFIAMIALWFVMGANFFGANIISLLCILIFPIMTRVPYDEFWFITQVLLLCLIFYFFIHIDFSIFIKTLNNISSQQQIEKNWSSPFFGFIALNTFISIGIFFGNSPYINKSIKIIFFVVLNIFYLDEFNLFLSDILKEKSLLSFFNIQNYFQNLDSFKLFLILSLGLIILILNFIRIHGKYYFFKKRNGLKSNDVIKISFHGKAKLSNKESLKLEHEESTLDCLNKNSFYIEKQISQEIENKTNIKFDVDIQFRPGSIEWIGYLSVTIDTLANSNTLTALANVGGALAFGKEVIGWVQNSFNTVMSKRLPDYRIERTIIDFRNHEATDVYQQQDNNSSRNNENIPYFMCMSANIQIWTLILTVAIFTMGIMLFLFFLTNHS